LINLEVLLFIDRSTIYFWKFNLWFYLFAYFIFYSLIFLSKNL